jgi:hypothetical protein
MGLNIWSLSNPPGSKQRPFYHCPTSLPTALTGPHCRMFIVRALCSECVHTLDLSLSSRRKDIQKVHKMCSTEHAEPLSVIMIIQHPARSDFLPPLVCLYGRVGWITGWVKYERNERRYERRCWSHNLASQLLGKNGLDLQCPAILLL